jgi:drug/metabolite transporter (DMT)-like permease
VWFRFLFAFIILAIWQAFTAPKSFKILIKPPWALVIAAIALTWNYIGFMLGIHYTTPSNAQLFIQTGPLLLAFAGFLIFKEKLDKKQTIGFIIAIIGFIFFYNDQLSAFLSNAGEYKMGILIVMSAALMWTLYAILQKKLVNKYTTNQLNLFIFGLPVIVLAPFIHIRSLLNLSFGWWLIMCFLGANTVIAYTCVAQALKYTAANKVSIILIVNPMLTLFAMWFLERMQITWVEYEHFSMETIIGALFVFTGAIFVSLKTHKHK